MRGVIPVLVLMILFASPVAAQMYKWVDEKGTVHFTDDPARIPEKHLPDAESRKTPKESTLPKSEEKPSAVSPLKKTPENQVQSFEVPIARRGELSLAEVILNGRNRQHFIVDTGASFTSISRQTAMDLDVAIDENTPFIPIVTASDVILCPLVQLRSVRVGKAEVENVDVLVHNLPGDNPGLLGNSFLNKFRVTLDAFGGKMILIPQEGKPSPDRPGGYGKDYWVGRFRFYHNILAGLKKSKAAYERSEWRSELNRVANAIRYFENQLGELDRKASFAGVPRNWRE
jgi:clan AA aspartic protease (TIGR02281 family)